MAVSMFVSSSMAAEKTITVSCDDWVGFCNKDGSGWYLDILREIYNPHGINIKVKIEPFARGLDAVKSGSADVVLTGYNIPERRKEYVLSTIRIDNEQTIVTFLPPTSYSPDSFAKSRVAYVRGVAYQSHFAPTMTLIEVTRRTQAIDLLIHKRIDYFLAEMSETLQAINELELKPADFSFARIDVKPLYVMFQKNNQGQELAKQYDEGIVKLYELGRPQALAKQYHIPDFSVYFPEIEALHSTGKPGQPKK